MTKQKILLYADNSDLGGPRCQSLILRLRALGYIVMPRHASMFKTGDLENCHVVIYAEGFERIAEAYSREIKVPVETPTGPEEEFCRADVHLFGREIEAITLERAEQNLERAEYQKKRIRVYTQEEPGVSKLEDIHPDDFDDEIHRLEADGPFPAEQPSTVLDALRLAGSACGVSSAIVDDEIQKAMDRIANNGDSGSIAETDEAADGDTVTADVTLQPSEGDQKTVTIETTHDDDGALTGQRIIEPRTLAEGEQLQPADLPPAALVTEAPTPPAGDGETKKKKKK
jgi:hypothetical protein